MLKLYMKHSLLVKENIQPFILCQTLVDYQFSDEWLTPAVLAALRGIDKGEYLGNRLFHVEHLGYVRLEDLSGGLKTLMSIRNINPTNWRDPVGEEHKGEKLFFPSTFMGSNVFPYLGAVADELDYDVNIGWTSCVYPKKWGDAKVNAMLMDVMKPISSWQELCTFMLANPQYLQPYLED